MTSVSWLHLSDLHRGMTVQKWLWTTIEADFFDDLKKLHNRCGPWDVILFTGDLTQKGKPDEFLKLNETMKRLYQVLNELGSDPVFLVVPGNHDLERPQANDPAVKLLTEWSKRPDIREEFWSDSTSPYRRIIEQSFASYKAWCTTQPFPKPEDITTGLLPGDFSSTVTKGEIKVGIIGLNITFLQLTEGNYEGKLTVHPLQLSEICGEHYEDWFRARDINILMTHQPPSWLDTSSKEFFDSEIYPPGRFITHMYGHMHKYQNYNLVIGGAKPKRHWQACSLFGLEYYGNKKKLNRSHGYTLGQLNMHGDIVDIYIWPRIAQRHQAGHWHIVADTSSTLTEGESLPVASIKLPRKAQAKHTSKRTTTKPFRVLLLATDTDLSGTRNAIAEHLKRALGVEATKGAAISPPDPSVYDLVVLLQGCGGTVVALSKPGIKHLCRGAWYSSWMKIATGRRDVLLKWPPVMRFKSLGTP